MLIIEETEFSVHLVTRSPYCAAPLSSKLLKSNGSDSLIPLIQQLIRPDSLSLQNSVLYWDSKQSNFIVFRSSCLAISMITVSWGKEHCSCSFFVIFLKGTSQLCETLFSKDIAFRQLSYMTNNRHCSWEFHWNNISYLLT